MTPEQIAANRTAMVVTVRQQQGLTGIAPSDWTNEQRQDYLQALSEYMLARPGLFTQDELFLAQKVNSAGPVALENVGVFTDISVFSGAFADEAKSTVADPLASLGKAVSNVVSLIAKYLPFILVGIALFFVVKTTAEFKRANKAD